MRLAFGIVLVWIGTLALAVALLGTVTVATVVNTVGTRGVVTTSFGEVTSGPADVAVIIDEVSAEVRPPADPQALWSFLADRDIDLLGEVGDLVLTVRDERGGELAIGTGPRSAIDAYLAGSPYSAVVRVPDGWAGRSVPGDRPVPDPQNQPFWDAFDVGSPAQIPAASLNGRTLLVMNADSSAPVAATLEVEYRVPQAQEAIRRAALIGITGGVLALIFIPLGAWVIAGPRRRRH